MRHLPFLLALALLAALPCFAQNTAKQHYKLGRAAEKRGSQLEAYSQYLQARAAAPGKGKYLRAAERMRLATAQAIAIQTTGETVPTDDNDSTPLFIESLFERSDPLQEALGATQLEVEHKLASFRFEGQIQDAYKRLGEEYGVDVLFDEGFSGSRRTKFYIDDVDFRDAVMALNEVATAFVVPLTPKLVLIANDTPAKRGELEPVVSVNIPIPEAVTPQDATEVGQAVQQILELRRLFVVPSRNIVTIRDSPAKVRVARLLLERLLAPSSELVLEIELISYNRDRDTEIGLNLPGAFPVKSYATVFNAIPPDAASNETGVGGGQSLFGIGIANSQLVAALSSGIGSTTQQFSVRASSGKMAQVKIGERFPIISSTFQADTNQEGDFVLPPPSFTFEDLGLNVDVTPLVHGSNEVSLQMQVEFNLLAGGAVNGLPILVNRTLETQVRLQEGEAAIIAGMAIDETRKTQQTPLGLERIPFIRRLFSRNQKRVNSTDLLVLVRPRIVRLPAFEIMKELNIRFGSDLRPLQVL